MVTLMVCDSRRWRLRGGGGAGWQKERWGFGAGNGYFVQARQAPPQRRYPPLQVGHPVGGGGVQAGGRGGVQKGRVGGGRWRSRFVGHQGKASQGAGGGTG